MTTYYAIDYWHTTKNEWCEDAQTEDRTVAEFLYQQTLEWHYAQTVRIRKVTEEIIKQSKDPQVVRALPPGVIIVGLDDPAELHRTIKDAVGE